MRAWAAVFGIVVACGEGTNSPHAALGYPSPAAPGLPTRWLVEKPQYAVAFDTEKKIPAWVAWKTGAANLGKTPRCNCWAPAPELASAAQPDEQSYAHSGFDRGHLCPSDERTANGDDNRETFRFINIVPQVHEPNAGAWAALERELVARVRAGATIYSFAGPIPGRGGWTSTRLWVPQALFKVVVGFGGSPPPGATRTATAWGLAVAIPNAPTATQSWESYRTTIREVEDRTGFDFANALSREEQDALEQ